MRAGRLHHRITITRPLNSNETTQNSFGEDVTSSPVQVGTFSCEVLPIQGNEGTQDMQRMAKATYQITMRRQPGIVFRPKMQATWNGRTLDITDVRDPGDSSRPEVVMTARDFAG